MPKPVIPPGGNRFHLLLGRERQFEPCLFHDPVMVEAAPRGRSVAHTNRRSADRAGMPRADDTFLNSRSIFQWYPADPSRSLDV